MLIKVSIFFQRVIFQRNFNSNFILFFIQFCFFSNLRHKSMIQRFKDKRNISNKTKIDNYFTNEKKNYTACWITIYLILQLINKLKLYSRKEQRNFD